MEAYLTSFFIFFLYNFVLRQRDLTGAQPETLSDLEDYAEQGHSSILYLILEALNVRDQDSEYAASHVGVCSGITTLMRGFPHHASQVSCYSCDGTPLTVN